MYYNMLAKYIQSSGEENSDIQKKVIDHCAESWICWHRGHLITKCLLEIINLSQGASLQVLPHFYVQFLTPGFPATEVKPWLLLIAFINKLIKGRGLENKTGILLYACGLGELWFLRTKNCYIIPNTATISPCNAYSYVSQRSYKLPKDKTCVLNLFLCLTYTYLECFAHTGFAGLDIHRITMELLN